MLNESTQWSVFRIPEGDGGSSVIPDAGLEDQPPIRGVVATGAEGRPLALLAAGRFGDVEKEAPGGVDVSSAGPAGSGVVVGRG